MKIVNQHFKVPCCSCEARASVSLMIQGSRKKAFDGDFMLQLQSVNLSNEVTRNLIKYALVMLLLPHNPISCFIRRTFCGIFKT